MTHITASKQVDKTRLFMKFYPMFISS